MGRPPKKPSMMSVREHIYRKVSQDLEVPHAIVKQVLDNQFRTALSALKDNNSLEIAGFGKILLNIGRVKVEIKRLTFLTEYYQKLLDKGGLDNTVRFEYEGIVEKFPKKIKELKERLEKYEKSKKRKSPDWRH